MKRRDFIQQIAAASVYAQLPFLVKCAIPDKSKVEQLLEHLPPFEPLTELQAKTCVIVQQILFPDTKNTPGSIALNSFPFFISVINDAWRDASENKYLIKGLDKLNNKSKEEFNYNFTELSIKQQQEILAKHIDNGGENWASAMLSVIFESLFANPVYGCNPKGIGWKWLHYVPGQPQPDKENEYHHLLKKRKSENNFITGIHQIINE